MVWIVEGGYLYQNHLDCKESHVLNWLYTLELGEPELAHTNSQLMKSLGFNLSIMGTFKSSFSIIGIISASNSLRDYTYPLRAQEANINGNETCIVYQCY